MKKVKSPSKLRGIRLSALAGLVFCIQAAGATAQNLVDVQTRTTPERRDQPIALPLDQRPQVTYDAYILGPGDGLRIELLDLPELSGRFSIGPDGTMYLPRLRAFYVEGLTAEELRYFLTQQFSTYVRDPQVYVRDPQVYVRPVVYRPIRIHVGGEVKRPGYYTLSRDTNLKRLSESAESQQLQQIVQHVGSIARSHREGKKLRLARYRRQAAPFDWNSSQRVRTLSMRSFHHHPWGTQAAVAETVFLEGAALEKSLGLASSTTRSGQSGAKLQSSSPLKASHRSSRTKEASGHVTELSRS